MKRPNALTRRGSRGLDIVYDPNIPPGKPDPASTPARSDGPTHVLSSIHHQRDAMWTSRPAPPQEWCYLAACHLRYDPSEDGRDVSTALEAPGKVRWHRNEDRAADTTRSQRRAEEAAEVEDEVPAGTMLGREDVLARGGLRPVVPTSNGSVKGRRRASAGGAHRPIGERLREPPCAARAARTRQTAG